MRCAVCTRSGERKDFPFEIPTTQRIDVYRFNIKRRGVVTVASPSAARLSSFVGRNELGVAAETQTSGQVDHVAIVAPSSPRHTWAIRSAVRASHRTALGIAAVGTVTAASSAFAHDVPVAAAVPALALIPAALVDVIDRRLPNRMVVRALAITAAAIAVTFILGGQLDVADAVIGAGYMSVPLLVIHLISPRSMGLGDVKAAAVLGTGLGLIAPELAFVSLALGSAGAATVGLVRRRGDIAFGPGLVGGAIATLALVALPINLVHSLDRSANTGPPPLTLVTEQENPQ